MKKILKVLFIFCVLVSGVFVKNATISTEMIASAENVYDRDIISYFEDNEALSEIQASQLSVTEFNVLDEVEYEPYDQDQYGTCYAASLAQTINLSYEYRTGEHIRLSPLALAIQYKDLFFDDGSHDIEFLNNSFNLKYVSEYDFPYEQVKPYYENQNTSAQPNLNFEGKEVLDVTEYYSFPMLTSSSSAEFKQIYIDNIKKALVNHGALSIAISYKVTTSGEYNVYDAAVPTVGGHALTLVGFDDSFPGSVFGHASNGAFIILNSWGSSEKFIYMSYEDVPYEYLNSLLSYSGFGFIFGVDEFIEFDERAESVSNMKKAYYQLPGNYSADTNAMGREIGYLVSNTTSNTHLSQIDLQPLFNTIALYEASTDIKLYVGAGTQDLENGSYQFVGDYDISGGVNKIVLDEPLEVSKNFSIKIVIDDDYHMFGYVDASNQAFEAIYKIDDNWSVVSYSEHNYNLIRTPFYLRMLFTDGTNYSISKADNIQTATTNAVEFDISSANTEISSVGVEVYRITAVSSSFDSFSVTETEVSDEFNIATTTSSVSLQKKTFSGDTYKVVINVNGGEKQFIKFLFFDDGIDLIRFSTYAYRDIWTNRNKLLNIFSTSLSADVVNVTIPSSASLYYVNGKDFEIENIFDYNSADVEVSVERSIDTQQRISKATVTFSNASLGTSKTILFNFIYDTRNMILYVTKLANATHSNPKYVNNYTSVALTAASAPNHNFLGWYTDAACTQPATDIYFGNSGNVVYYYAKFEEKTAPSVAKKARYDATTNILTVSLDFSDYNLAIYDTIVISNITHTFKTITYPYPVGFIILKTTKYDYQIYVEEVDMNVINTLAFDVVITRWGYREQTGFYDTLSQSVTLTDKVKVSITKKGTGEIYNSITGESIESGDIYIDYGGKLDMNFVPDDNHQIKMIRVNGEPIIVTEEYTFSNLVQNQTFEIEFELISYEISAIVTGDGELDKSTIQMVKKGETITYNFTPGVGSYLQSLTVDGTPYAVNGVTSYTFRDVQENHVIIIVFAKYEFTITATVVGSGSIGHSLIKNANYGDDVNYIFTPSAGYHLKQILVDGSEITLASSYLFEDITENHTIYVKFEKDVINVSLVVVGNGQLKAKKVSSGSVLESTTTSVTFNIEYEESLKFEFVADYGYQVDSILLNGTSVGAQESLTRSNIIDDIEVKVYFILNTYTLKLTINGSGVSNLATNLVKNHGETAIYNFTPSTGYQIAEVFVDGENKGAISTYTFENITSNHTIAVTFVIQNFEIKWFNHDGTLIFTSNFNYGTYPTATFENPKKPAEGNYVFDFIGWNSKADGTGTEIVSATENASYYAQFNKHLVQFAIKVSAGTNGDILPAGDSSHNVMVDYDASQTFVIVAKSGYHVAKVYVDGKSVDNLESYTFENVKEEHTISAVFKRNDFKATVVNDEEKGNVSGSTWFENGERATYKITPKEGFIVDSVFVNGKKVTCENNSFILENVTSDIEIVVNYVSKKDSSLFSNFSKTIVIGAVGVAVIGVGVAVVYFVKLKRKKKGSDLDEWDEN